MAPDAFSAGMGVAKPISRLPINGMRNVALCDPMGCMSPECESHLFEFVSWTPILPAQDSYLKNDPALIAGKDDGHPCAGPV